MTHGWRRPVGVAALLLCAALALGGCASMGESEEPKAAEATAHKVPPEAFEMAQKALSENRLPDAEGLVDRILLADPGNLEARLLRGEVILAKGRPNQAMTLFSGLQELPEVSARARQGMGICLLLTDQPDQAVDHLKAAVAADPTLWRAWNALGSYYDSQGQWEDSIEAYDKALDQHPNDAMVLNNRGFSYFMQGRLDEAIDDLQRALRLEPDLRPAQLNLRLAHAWNGNYLYALSGVTDKEMPQVLNNIGYVAMMRGDLDNAEAYLRRAMEADASFNKKAWNNLARLRQIREMGATAVGSRPASPRDITAEAPGE